MRHSTVTRKFSFGLLGCLLAALLTAWLLAGRLRASRQPWGAPHHAQAASTPLGTRSGAIQLSKLAQGQLGFEANRGLAATRVKFIARGQGYTLGLAANEMILHLQPATDCSAGRAAALRLRTREEWRSQRRCSDGALQTVRMKFAGANPQPKVRGLEALPGTTNYLIGNDARRWQTGVPRYAKVEYQDLYPGINLVYYGQQRQLEYDLIVAPGADPRRIKLSFTGVERVALNEQGELLLRTADGEVVQHAPRIYQKVDGDKRTIKGRYVLTGQGEVRFELGAYDASRALVIDPVLSYATYLGGGGESGNAIAADAAGNVYVTGSTASLNFPTRNPAQPTPGGGRDVFVTKLNAAGLPVYSTYLGGSSGGSSALFDTGNDFGFAIAVDAEGNAYVTGSTESPNFPVVNAWQRTSRGLPDAFVAKLNPAGNALLYSTFLGGNDFDQGYGIAVDAASNAYITGYAGSADFPTTPGTLKPRATGSDFTDEGFVTKLNPAGSVLVWSTFLGGNGFDEGNAIALDSAGNSFIAGDTSSTDFPTTPGAAQTINRSNAGEDAFVTKLNATGTALIYSTYFGGGGNNDLGFGIAVDAAGLATVVGVTDSTDLVTTLDALQRSYGGGRFDGFGLRLDASGALLYATYFGGGGNDQAYSVSLDPAGNVWASGFTDSSNLPVANPLQATIGGSGVFKSVAGGSSWSGSGAGLLSVTLLALALDPTASATLYAGTGGAGVFKSANGGSSWSASNNGLPNSAINALALNPATPTTLYAGTNGSGVFKSANGGGSWSAMNSGLSSLFIRTIIIDRATPTTLYAGASSGLFKSTDGAANWTRFSTANGLPSSSIRALAIDPATPTTLYAGTTSSGISKSTNGGSSWSTINTGLSNRNIRALALDPVAPQTLYAGTLGGVFKSTNGGGSWSAASTGLTDLNVFALAIDPVTPATVYAATGSGVFKSTNGGGNWSAAISGLTALRINALALDPRVPATLYAGASSGDAFVARVTPSGALDFATYLGGGGSESGNGIVVDGAGNAYVTGSTTSTNLPATPGAFQASPGNAGAAFVTKLSDAFTCTLSCTATAPSTGTAGLPIAFTATTGGCAGATTQVWDFGDQMPRLAQTNPTHVYLAPGIYTWTLAALNSGASACTQTGIITITGRGVANVSAASFTGDELARDAIVAAFGVNLATMTQAATSTPLPTTLAGTTVRITDSVGATRLAPLFFVAPGQVNYLIPAETALGRATVTVTSSDAAVSLGSLPLADVAPGLFSANADGRGVPAAVALRVRSNGAQSFEPVARFDQAANRFVPVPLDLGPASDQLFLILFGTGLRGRTALTGVSIKLGPPTGVDASVSFAGAQGDLAGLDQINVGPLPRSLAGRGEVDVVLTVDGKVANTVRINIK